MVNFMTQKIIVEFEDGQEPKAVMQAVLKPAKRWSQTVRSRCKDRRRAPEADGQRGAFSSSYDSTYA